MFFWNQPSNVDEPPQEPDEAAAANSVTNVPLAAPTPQQYKHLLDEVETVNEEVTKLRQKLWEAQDTLKERDDAVRTLENHVNELLERREKDDQTIKMLKENNAALVEEESKVRESLELMRKVFTRAQLKAKEDQETIALLREERDDLLQRTKELKNNPSVTGTQSKFDMIAVRRIKEASDEKETNLKTLLFQTEKELEQWKKKNAIATVAIKNMKLQIAAMKDPNEASKQLEKQRRLIDRLEQQITELEIEEMEREREVRDDEMARDNEVIHRACFDEDLDLSLTRNVIRKLDCSAAISRC